MTAVHFAQENVGWSRNVVITFDLVSEDADIVGAAMVGWSVKTIKKYKLRSWGPSGLRARLLGGLFLR